MTRISRGPKCRTVVLACALVLGAVLGGCSVGTMPAVRSEPERLELARQAMARHNYTLAIELLKSYVANNGGSRDVDEAIYRLGMSYAGAREYPSAQVEFERLVRDYPESDSSGSASFRLGEMMYAQTRGRDFDQEYTHKALEQWQDYLASYHGHWLNAAAQVRVAELRGRLAGKLADAGRLYLKLRLPGPARAYYRRVLDEYPETPAHVDARFGLALCDAQQGYHTEAIAQLKQIEAAYPNSELARHAAIERARIERNAASDRTRLERPADSERARLEHRSS
jgi:outer membrane protein assembly factor BamD